MATLIKDSDNLYGSEIVDIHKRVKKCYDNLEKSDLKFTKDMITLINLDFIDHSESKITDIKNAIDLSPVTKRYIDECDKQLGTYNILDIRQNLEKMNLI